MFVVERSATGGEIMERSIALAAARTLPVRIGGGVEVLSRLLMRVVKARARDIVAAIVELLLLVVEFDKADVKSDP